MTKQLRVAFVTIEEGDDLILGFALAPHAHDMLTVFRSPHLEHIFPPEQRGIEVALDDEDEESDLLREVVWTDDAVVLRTDRHAYVLDIQAVSDEDIGDAKALLQRMAADGAARLEGV